MWKVIKYKLADMMKNRLIQALVILFFAILNISIIISSYDLTHGGMEFNRLSKYLILMSKFTDISNLLGLMISIFIGSCLIAEDIENGNIYILSTSFPKRAMYYAGSFIAMCILMFILIITILTNYIIIAAVFKVGINYKDLYYCFSSILINNMVIATITTVFSILYKGTIAITMGIFSLIVYNVYSFSRIPIINMSIELGLTARKILAYLVPINSVEIMTVYNNGIIERYNMVSQHAYQLIYISIIFGLGMIAFKRKEM